VNDAVDVVIVGDAEVPDAACVLHDNVYEVRLADAYVVGCP